MRRLAKKIFHPVTLRSFGALIVGALIVAGLTGALATAGNFFDAEREAAPLSVRVPQSEAAMKEMTEEVLGTMAPAATSELPEIAPAAGDEEKTVPPPAARPAQK